MGRRGCLFFLSLVILLGACVNIGSSQEVKSVVSAPPVISCSVNPIEVESGRPALLMWNVENANTVFIDQGIGSRKSSGFLTVIPKADTTYTITATNSAGKSTKSISLKVLPRVASLNIAKPGVNVQTAPANSLPIISQVKIPVQKTYKETIYDFVMLAPTASWSTLDYYDNKEVPIEKFPSTSPELKIWENMVLENNTPYKQVLYMNVPRRNNMALNVINGVYPVNIPANSWFTARIGMPKLPSPPPNDMLMAEIRPSLWGVNWKGGCGLGVYSIYYDDNIEYVDVDISLQSGGNMIGTSGWFLINVWVPDGNNGTPIAFGDLRIVRP